MEVGRIPIIFALLASGILSLVVQTSSTENCSFEKCVTGNEFCNSLPYKKHCEKCALIPDYCQYPDKKEQCQLISCKNQEIRALEERFKEEERNKSKERDFLIAQNQDQSKIIEGLEVEVNKTLAQNKDQSKIIEGKEVKLNKTLDKIADLENSIKTIKDTYDEKLRRKEKELMSERDKSYFYYTVIVILLVPVICSIPFICWQKRISICDYCSSFKKKIFPERQLLSEGEKTLLNVPPYIKEDEMEFFDELDNEKKQTPEREIQPCFTRMENEKQTTVKQPSTLPSDPVPLLDASTPRQPSAPQPPAAAADVEPPHIPIATPQPCHQNIPGCNQGVHPTHTIINCQTYDNSHKTNYTNSAIGAHLSGSSAGSVTSPVSHQPSNISNSDSTETTCTRQEQEQQLNVSQDEARMPITREEHRQPIQVSEENQH